MATSQVLPPSKHTHTYIHERIAWPRAYVMRSISSCVLIYKAKFRYLNISRKLGSRCRRTPYWEFPVSRNRVDALLFSPFLLSDNVFPASYKYSSVTEGHAKFLSFFVIMCVRDLVWFWGWWLFRNVYIVYGTWLLSLLCVESSSRKSVFMFFPFGFRMHKNIARTNDCLKCVSSQREERKKKELSFL